MRTGSVVFILAWFGASGPLAQGQEQSPPVYRAEGVSILVDAVVTDDKNRVVTDLTAGDFEIYEDGIRQSIDTFELYRPPNVSERGGPESQRPESWELPPGREKEANLIVFLLDYATTRFEHQKLVQDACLKFVQEDLRPGDYVAVFALGSGLQSLQDFTADPEKLVAALQWRSLAADAMGARSLSGPQLSVEEQQRLSGGLGGNLQVDPGQGASAMGQAAAREAAVQAQLMLGQRIENLFRTMISFARQREARSVLTAIQAISRGLSRFPGRKALILFSEGFVIGTEMEAELEKTILLANRSNLAIYSVDAQGLLTRGTRPELVPRNELHDVSALQGRSRIEAAGGESLFDRARQVGSDVRDSALRYVSAATGGFAIRNTNDLYVGMERIYQDTHSYYLMSYRPSNQEFDGKFREIEVRVRRKGLTVRTLKGYTAVPPGMELVSGEEFRLLQSAWNGSLPLNLPAYFRLDELRGREGELQVLTTLEIPSRNLHFGREEEEPRWTARLEVIGLVRDEDGHALLRFGTPMNLHASQQEYEALQAGGISFTNTVRLPPGRFLLQLFLQDRHTRSAAWLEQPIQLEPPSDKLTLSSLILGKEVDRSSPEDLLSADGVRVLPSAQRRFGATDRLVFFFQVYNFQTESGSGKPKLELQVSLRRSGSPQVISLPRSVLREGAASGEALLAVARYIELTGLEPGVYFLDVEVVDQVNGESARTRTSFQVVP